MKWNQNQQREKKSPSRLNKVVVFFAKGFTGLEYGQSMDQIKHTKLNTIFDNNGLMKVDQSR